MIPVPLKNIVHVEGVRSNLLVGYGLVVGLNGTGDTLRSSPFTKESMTSMLNRLGVNTRLGGPGKTAATMNTRNVAAVMVTAKLPPFARQGMPIDISVSALGDARSLRGGTLLVTPMMGADGEVYAVGQGTLASSSFQATGGAQPGGAASGTSVTRGVPTAAAITGGAIVEREIPFALDKSEKIRLCLSVPNFTTAKRVAQVVRDNYPFLKPRAIDPGTVVLTIPSRDRPNLVSLFASIEELQIVPNLEGRVIVNEQEGVIVIGSDVRVSTVAVSQGNLTISIQENLDVSQPTNLFGAVSSNAEAGAGGTAGNATAESPFSGIKTVVTSESNIQVAQDNKNIGILRGVSLKELVDGLNAFNLPTQDLSAVLRAIHAAGALHAKLEIL